MQSDTKQREWLATIAAASHSPLYVCSNYLKVDKFVPGKRMLWTQSTGIIDHRSVSSNEVIFEIDAQYSTARKYAVKILESLEGYGVVPIKCISGGKGIHISFWFDADIPPGSETETLLKVAMSKGFSYREIREWLWNKILDEAGIPEDVRGIGHGKHLDKSAIHFDDLRGKNKLIRCIGGRKQEIDPITKEVSIGYKTMVEEFPTKGAKVKSYSAVLFPTEIKKYKVDIAELGEMLQNFIARSEQLESKKPTEKISGKYIELDGVMSVREGLRRGSRAAGARIIAIAAANDSLPISDAYELVKQYCENCSQIGESFNFEEAKAWVDWIYRQPNVFWNCGLLVDLGLHIKENCAVCTAENRETTALLEHSGLLDSIKEILDAVIVGESDVKLLIFLLALSKDFPTNTPWNIFGDPKTQAVILNCDSGSGKSYVAKQVLKLFPPGCVDIHSRITRSALNYYAGQDMDGKIIMIEELQSVDDESNQLRLWISEGVLKLTTVEKRLNEKGEEENVMVQKTTTGTPFFITGTAEDTVEHQLNTRMWMLSLDLSEEQNQKILAFQDLLAQQKVDIPYETIRSVQDALAELKPYHFINIFANNELLNPPTREIRIRRDYEKFLTLMCCIAYLHQKQRTILKDDHEREYILCSITDYIIAREIAQRTLSATFLGLSQQHIAMLKTIIECSNGGAFTPSDVVGWARTSSVKANSALQHLKNNSFIVDEGMDHGQQVFKVNPGRQLKDLVLPDVKIAEVSKSWEESLSKLFSVEKQWTKFQIVQQAKYSEPSCENLERIIAENIARICSPKEKKDVSRMVEQKNEGLNTPLKIPQSMLDASREEEIAKQAPNGSESKNSSGCADAQGVLLENRASVYLNTAAAHENRFAAATTPLPPSAHPEEFEEKVAPAPRIRKSEVADASSIKNSTAGKIFDIIRKSAQGVHIDELTKELNIDKKIILRMLFNGELFEPKPGMLKVAE